MCYGADVVVDDDVVDIVRDPYEEATAIATTRAKPMARAMKLAVSRAVGGDLQCANIGEEQLAKATTTTTASAAKAGAAAATTTAMSTPTAAPTVADCVVR